MRADLALYDRLLAENDQDLMAWVLGQVGRRRRWPPLLAGSAPLPGRGPG
jgi:hypothetical protein